MSLPELPEDPPDPRDWARQVRRDEPHGLDQLEALVIAWSAQADELAKTSNWQIVWRVMPALALLASIGGFAAVFGNPRDVFIGRVDAPDANDIPWAALSYGVASVGVILILIRWIADGRHRNGALQIVLGLTFLFGALGIPIVFQLAAEEGSAVGLMMLPAYVMMALAVVVFVLIQLSPRREPAPEAPGATAVSIDDLGEKAMGYLMKERSQAIDILKERRMLPENIDVEALKARPLGRLHIEEDA